MLGSLQMTCSYAIAKLTSDSVLNIALFGGPKAAVCLALSADFLAKISPIDENGITKVYIQSLPCPHGIHAGGVGITVHDLIEIKTRGGNRDCGFITHVTFNKFFYRSLSGAEKLIGFQSIVAVNNESIPTVMPCVQPELFFSDDETGNARTYRRTSVVLSGSVRQDHVSQGNASPIVSFTRITWTSVVNDMVA